MTQPDSPVLENNFALPTGFTNSMGAHVEIRDNLAYVTAYGLTMNASVGGLAIYKIYDLAFPVTIDIKPGSDPNCVNINGHGVIPVAILGTDTFDVSNIDPSTLIFAGLEVRVRGNRGPSCGLEDTDSDGYLDLVCQFEDNPDYWTPGDGEATLTGTLFDGTQIVGTDSICVVP